MRQAPSRLSAAANPPHESVHIHACVLAHGRWQVFGLVAGPEPFLLFAASQVFPVPWRGSFHIPLRGSAGFSPASLLAILVEWHQRNPIIL